MASSDTPDSQRARFIETARALEADKSKERFNETLRRVVKLRKQERNGNSS